MIFLYNHLKKQSFMCSVMHRAFYFIKVADNQPIGGFFILIVIVVGFKAGWLFVLCNTLFKKLIVQKFF